MVECRKATGDTLEEIIEGWLDEIADADDERCAVVSKQQAIQRLAAARNIGKQVTAQ